MINWIQGKPLGRKFKALVCHDGIFNTENQYATEELWFPNHDVSNFTNLVSNDEYTNDICIVWRAIP